MVKEVGNQNEGQAMCTVCQSTDLQSCLSLGMQPPSNRIYSPEAGSLAPEEYCPLSLGCCQQCGTIQLVDRMSVETIRPRYDWMIYSEPEGHLDAVASQLAGLPSISASSRFLGVTYIDQSTLDRMERMGFLNTACISKSDLKCPAQIIGLESIQEALSDTSTVGRLQELYGEVDVLLVRYIVEHATNASRFIRSLKGLLAPNGYMMLEVPDSERIFHSGNHALIWEEHISYFTETSMSQLAKAVGATQVWLKRYPYPYEDTLNVLFRFTGTDGSSAEPLSGTSEVSASLLAEFAKGLNESRVNWRKKLEDLRAQGEKVAVFGAGHLAAKFVNFYELADLIDCVIDDHPNKIGMLLPGSGLPVTPSSELSLRGIRVCISTLSPETEAKVRSKFTGFFDTGGRFIPAFAVG